MVTRLLESGTGESSPPRTRRTWSTRAAMAPRSGSAARSRRTARNAYGGRPTRVTRWRAADRLIQDGVVALGVKRPGESLDLRHLAAVVDADLRLDHRLELLAHGQYEVRVLPLDGRQVRGLGCVRLEV